MWGWSSPRGGNSRCKVPEAGVKGTARRWLVWLEGRGSREAAGRLTVVASGGHGRASAFTSICETEPAFCTVSLTSANTLYPQRSFEGGMTAANELTRTSETRRLLRVREPVPGRFQPQKQGPGTPVHARAHHAQNRCAASRSTRLSVCGSSLSHS